MLLSQPSFERFTGRRIADRQAFAAALVGRGPATRVDVDAAVDLGLVVASAGPERLRAGVAAWAMTEDHLAEVARAIAAGRALPVEDCARRISAAGGSIRWQRRWSAHGRGARRDVEGVGGRLRGVVRDLAPLPVGPGLRELAGAVLADDVRAPVEVDVDEALRLGITSARRVQGGSSIDIVAKARVWLATYPLATTVLRGGVGWRRAALTLHVRVGRGETAANARWSRVTVIDLLASPPSARLASPAVAGREDALALLDSGAARWAVQPMLVASGGFRAL